jgi:hypothetical protein
MRSCRKLLGALVCPSDRLQAFAWDLDAKGLVVRATPADAKSAQIMGHKPSGTHEKYKVRSIDALRPWAEKIERWFLNQAGIVFVPDEKRLRVVGAAQ